MQDIPNLQCTLGLIPDEYLDKQPVCWEKFVKYVRSKYTGDGWALPSSRVAAINTELKQYRAIYPAGVSKEDVVFAEEKFKTLFVLTWS